MSPPPSSCSACGRSSVVDGVCTVCGFTGGESNRCPHCGAVARVEPKGSGPKLHWVCGVCGGPRMPHGLGGEAATSPLREARASEIRSKKARASVWAFGLMAAFFTLIALAAWPAALAWKLFFLAFAVTPTLLAMRARTRATAAKADAKEALDRAWLAAAEDVARSTKKGVTVAELASRLKIDPVAAEALLTQLAVHDRTRIDVDDDAEVRYSIGPAEPLGAGRVRIDASGSEDQFRALEEAEAAASGRLAEQSEEQAVLSDPFPRRQKR
ncbi:MAG TPA: hypothetical protein VLT33_36680 [Labilithrix sp.]|nr:hypothetical protein [Labilithrix sp.]